MFKRLVDLPLFLQPYSIIRQIAAEQKRPPSRAASSASDPSTLRFEHDRAKRSRQIVAWSGRKEKASCRSIRSQTVAKVNSPQLVDHDRLPTRVLHSAHELSSEGVKRVNRPLIRVVADQQGTP